MEAELDSRIVAEFLVRLYGIDAVTVAEQFLAGSAIRRSAANGNGLSRQSIA